MGARAGNAEIPGVLSDIGAERATIAGIINHGPDALIDVEELLTASDFYGPHLSKLFSVLRYMVHERNMTEFDVPSILASAKMMGFDEIIGKGRDEEFIQSLLHEQISLDNTRSLAAVVFKLALGRNAYLMLRGMEKGLEKVKGDEPIDQILAMVEDPIFNFTSKVLSKDSTIVDLGQDAKAAMLARMDAPVEIMGMPTGFPKFDFAIGGGLRPGGVTVVGARSKVGKSFLCLNMALKMAQAKIPVLILDTELPQKMQQNRLISLVSGVEIVRVETGQFASVPEERQAVLNSTDLVEGLPIKFCSIAGQSIKNVLSIVRRWLVRHVGLEPDGTAKPCVVFYDYLKLMDSGDLKSNVAEFQLLGFLLSEMHNFCLKYDIPVLATVQLNRDGGDKEDATVISGSDRILWLATSFTILKKKSTNELNADPATNGRHKLVVTDTRCGPGLEGGEYINVKADLSRAKMDEGPMGSVAQAKNSIKPCKKWGTANYEAPDLYENALSGLD